MKIDDKSNVRWVWINDIMVPRKQVVSRRVKADGSVKQGYKVEYIGGKK